MTRKILLTSIIAITSILIAGQFGMQDAHATQYTLDQNYCETTIRGTWSTSTCTITTGDQYLLSGGNELVIPNGVTLVIQNSGGAGIYNFATITNDGTITIQNSAGWGIDNFNSGTITNNGTIDIQNTGGDGISAIITITNNGTITIQNSAGIGVYHNTGTITNNGTITIQNSAGIGVFNIATITNNGIIDIQNTGVVGINNFGTITNDGTITIQNSTGFGVLNYGTITNNCGATITGTVINIQPTQVACPDTDGDGIQDNLDECPADYGTLPNGCPSIDDAIAQVEALDLNNGVENSLIKKLEQAQKNFENMDDAEGCEKLYSYIDQLNALVSSGKLTQPEIDPLVALAQVIIDDLCVV